VEKLSLNIATDKHCTVKTYSDVRLGLEPELENLFAYLFAVMLHVRCR
jgi:hypothetical protein